MFAPPPPPMIDASGVTRYRNRDLVPSIISSVLFVNYPVKIRTMCSMNDEELGKSI